METVHKLEVTVASWYKALPHLPEGGRKWIANNVWWLVLVGVILSLMVIIPAFGVILFSSAVLTVYSSTNAYYGAAFIPALLGLIILVADMVLSILAISPLKSHQKRGWSLLFITMLLGVLSAVLSLFANQDFGSFLSGLIGAALGGYFLFEIRDKFNPVATKTQPTASTPVAGEAKKNA